MRRAPLASIRAAALALTAAAPVLVPAVVSAPALAQIQDVEARWAVVTQKDTPARCDDFDRFYKVATFQPGQVLRVDGQSADWARIVYPASMHALVPASDARGAGQDRVELTIDSRLRAPSAVLGIAGSWHSLYAQALPAGTTLKVVGEELGANGEVVAYRVTPPAPPAAPEQPYAYVKLDALRDATEAEVKSHTASLRANVQNATESEADALVADVTPVTEAPARSQPQQPAPDYSTDLLEPMTPPGQERTDQQNTRQNAEQIMPRTPQREQAPVSTGRPASNIPSDASTDASTNQESGGSFDIVAEVEQGEQTGQAPGFDASASTAANARPASSTPRPQAEQPRQPELAPEPASIEDLESSLNATRRLPTESMDLALDELLAEYQRTLAAEAAKPNAEERTINALEQRVSWLELRIDTRDQRRAIEAALRESSERDEQVAEGVRRWQAERSYVVVGRLAPSAVYDGKRLPLMYRVMSVDPLMGSRTIAYVRPEAGQELAPHLGQIVGVVGDGADDAALRLRIIRAERVDELNSAFAQEPYTTE